MLPSQNKLQAAASAADLWDLRDGSLDAWMLVSLFACLSGVGGQEGFPLFFVEFHVLQFSSIFIYFHRFVLPAIDFSFFHKLIMDSVDLLDFRQFPRIFWISGVLAERTGRGGQDEKRCRNPEKTSKSQKRWKT